MNIERPTMNNDLNQFRTSSFDIRHSAFDLIFLSVFFVSLSTLAFEVLLTRVFSIGQWNHLSFMVISLALFGFAASGTFLSIVNIRRKSWLPILASRSGLAILLYLYAISAILSFVALNHLPLDYFRLPVETIQILYLLTTYAMLALPFFFSGMLISIAYITIPQKSGLVYFASMAGSAVGAVVPIPLLPLLGEGKAIVLSASISVLPIAYSICCSNSKQDAPRPMKQRTQRILESTGVLALVVFVLFLMDAKQGRLIFVKPSPYKALPQLLQFPATRIVATTSSIKGRVDRLNSPYIRFAPGLSLKFSGALPGQSALYTDGDRQLALYDAGPETDQDSFGKHMLSYSGYFLKQKPADVLLILDGGGSAIPCASASGANKITIVEQSGDIANILRNQYPHKVIQENPRAFLARSDRVFDIIQIENWGTSIPGSAALNQEHIFTIEAFIEFIKHLKPGGIVIISRKLLLPPSDSLRLWAAAYEALKETGAAQPQAQLAVIRNFDTFTLLVSNSNLDPDRIAEFSETHNFDLVFLPGMRPAMANRYNIFDQAYHFEAISRLSKMYRAGRQSVFFNTYFLDVAPQSDFRPFPGRLLKWSKIKTLFHSMGSRLYALFMSGEVVVLVVLVEALLIALVLLIIPLLVSTRGQRKPKIYQVIYFFAVGAGFMFVEIYFIKRFVIVVGDPVISFAVVIAGILFFSCLGGIWAHHKSLSRIRLPLAVLIIILVFEAFVFELFVPEILKSSGSIQFVSIFLILLPAGFLMGLPFPLGMRCLLDTPVQRAYAWSVNGCASVLSSILAAQVAISWGIPQVAATGVGAYVIALWAVGKR